MSQQITCQWTNHKTRHFKSKLYSEWSGKNMGEGWKNLLPSGCLMPGVIQRRKSSGVINISWSPWSPCTFRVAKYRKILSGVEYCRIRFSYSMIWKLWWSWLGCTLLTQQKSLLTHQVAKLTKQRRTQNTPHPLQWVKTVTKQF